MKVVVEMRERDYNTMKKGFLIVGVHDGKPLDEVLDEIAKEIKNIEYLGCPQPHVVLNDVLQIIDKYREGEKDG